MATLLRRKTAEYVYFLLLLRSWSGAVIPLSVSRWLPYLIFVTSTTSGAHVNFFGRCKKMTNIRYGGCILFTVIGEKMTLLLDWNVQREEIVRRGLGFMVHDKQVCSSRVFLDSESLLKKNTRSNPSVAQYRRVRSNCLVTRYLLENGDSLLSLLICWCR